MLSILIRMTATVLLALACFLTQPGVAAEPRAAEILKTTGVAHGVVVHVGATDGTLAAEIADSGEFLVLAVVEKEEVAGALRQEFDARPSGKRASVSLPEEGGIVPLPANTAALLVAELDANPPVVDLRELRRVVRPGGVLYVKQNGQWTLTRKPRPEAMGDWPQYFHDAAASDYSRDTLVGPARGLQWQTGDGDVQGGKMGYRCVGGIVVKVESDGAVVARDGFSGLPLWRRDDLSIANRYAFLVDEERVYCHSRAPGWSRVQPHMIALDLATGRTVVEFKQGFGVEYEEDDKGRRRPRDASRSPGYEDMIVRLSDGVLVQVKEGHLWALSAESGKLLWEADVSREKCRWMHPAAADGMLYALEGEKVRSYSYTHWPMTTCERIVAFHLKTGEQRWVWQWPKAWGEPDAAYNLALGNGKLALAVRDGKEKGGIHVLTLDANTGKQAAYVPGPWRSHGDKIKTTGGGHSHIRTLIRGDQLWISQIHGSVALDLDQPDKIVVEAHQNLRPIGCTVWRATPNYILGSLTCINPQGEGFFHTNAARTACDIGAFPANGLLYLPPNHCGCLSYLPVSNAFHSEKPQPPARFSRLERGSAQAADAEDTPWPAADAWPMYMRDPARSNWTDQPVAARPQLRWQTQVSRPQADEAAPQLAVDRQAHPFIEAAATPVTVAEGVCLTALPHEQAVVALDAGTGQQKWRIVVDGRVDSPPTIYRGLALFGTRNGWVYAVNRDTGELVWRFFAAPHRRRIVANGQLESSWPVYGTVLIEDGAAWVFAGRNVDLDGGIYWYRLRPASGEVLAQGRLGFDELLTGGDIRSRLLGSNMPPASDGQRLVFHNFVFDKSTGRASQHTPWEAQSLDCLTPCHMGLVHNGHKTVALNAHSHCYGVTRGWQIAYRGDDYVSILGSTERGNRGGNTSALALRLKRHPQDQELDPKQGKPQLVWKYERASNYWGKGGYFGIKAVAKAGDQVLVVASPEGHDGWRDREAGKHFLLLLDYETGKLLHRVENLPHNGIYAGLAVAGGRIYVTCRDGTICCLQ